MEVNGYLYFYNNNYDCKHMYKETYDINDCFIYKYFMG